MSIRLACVMIKHIQISEEIALALHAAAMEMIRLGQTRRLLSGRDYEAEIRTEFEKIDAAGVPGFHFWATVDLGSVSGKICFFMPTTYAHPSAIALVMVEVLAGPGTDEHGRSHQWPTSASPHPSWSVN